MIIPIVRYFIITHYELVDRYMPKVVILMMLADTIFSTSQLSEHNAEEREFATTTTNNINSNIHRHRLFNGSSISVRAMQDIAVLTSFGLASPLVAVAVSIDTIISNLIWKLLIGRYMEECGFTSSNRGLKKKKQQLQRLEEATKGASKGLFGCIFIVVGVVSVFWGLVVFDMTADVYGDFAGGMCVMGIVVGTWSAHGAALIYRDGVNERLSRFWTGKTTRKKMKSKDDAITMVDMNHTAMSPMAAMNAEFKNGSDITRTFDL
jgi:hypothetical protein